MNLQRQYLTEKLIILFLYESLSKKRQILLEYQVNEKTLEFPFVEVVIKTNLTFKNYEINKVLTKIGNHMGFADFLRIKFVFNHKKYKAKFPYIASRHTTSVTSYRTIRSF